MKIEIKDLPDLDLSGIGVIELVYLDEDQDKCPHSGFQGCTKCSCSKFNPENEYPPYGKCQNQGCGQEYNDHA